jgi:hypothetical protein
MLDLFDAYLEPRVSADPAVRTAALEALLVEKGLLSADAIDAVVEHYDAATSAPSTARAVVARAWVDPDFRARLLADGTAAVSELGISGFELNSLVAVENTPAVHNLVVCTLCSVLPVAVASAFRPSGTRSRPTGPARWPSRARSCASSGWSSRPDPRSASGTRRPRCATSSCRCARPAPRTWARRSWRRSSARDAMVGTAV